MDEIIDMFDTFDFLLVEGLKTLPLPRICVMRNNIEHSYFNMSDTIATNNTLDKTKLPKGIKILDLDDVDSIVKWIKQNGKKI
jgi:molybdopterin-guanine dinucleotide biosynthesis protein B